MLNNKVAFIISHKYIRNYESYIEYYIQNILKFYNNPLILVVDNNSNFKDDIFNNLKKYNNVVLLDNNITCKFEIGAYKVGLNYLNANNLINDYDYFVFTQDNFIIKNPYDFNNLDKNNVFAAQINSWKDNDWAHMDVSERVLKNINLFDKFKESKLCWCCSFVVSRQKINKLNDFMKDIVITTRYESCAAERFLGRIILELNDGKNFDIDGDIMDLKQKYDCWNVDLYSDKYKTYFVKKVQQKTERTLDV
jgi:hypothetical protein